MPRKWVPILNTLEFLLQGRPDELIDIRVGDSPESDRAVYVRVAGQWIDRDVLTAEERERIQAVWLDGHHRPPLNVNRERREELRALIVPRKREGRPNAEQLQAGMGVQP